MEQRLISREQFKNAVDGFIDKVYTPKVPQSSYLGYFGKIAVMNMMLAKHWNTIADSDGMVDVEVFYEQYNKMFDKTSSVEMQGFTMTRDDLNELYAMIKAQTPSMY